MWLYVNLFCNKIFPLELWIIQFWIRNNDCYEYKRELTVCMYVCVYVYVCVWVCVYVCVSVCVCV